MAFKQEDKEFETKWEVSEPCGVFNSTSNEDRPLILAYREEFSSLCKPLKQGPYIFIKKEEGLKYFSINVAEIFEEFIVKFNERYPSIEKKHEHMMLCEKLFETIGSFRKKTEKEKLELLHDYIKYDDGTSFKHKNFTEEQKRELSDELQSIILKIQLKFQRFKKDILEKYNDEFGLENSHDEEPKTEEASNQMKIRFRWNGQKWQLCEIIKALYLSKNILNSYGQSATEKELSLAFKLWFPDEKLESRDINTKLRSKYSNINLNSNKNQFYLDSLNPDYLNTLKALLSDYANKD
jgi:hypothetical protein